MSDCTIGQIATGQYFVGRHSEMRVIVACQRQVNNWVEWCKRHGGNDNSCTQQVLDGTIMLIRDAAAHRDNLKAWAREASR
jgi:hypothetical protein